MTAPALSVIVPVYNVEEYLDCCCQSILRSTFRDFELILVNDGSTDHSYDIASRIAESDRRVVLLTQQNAGLSAARNTGMAHARGEYIIFVDSDDWIEPECLASLYENIRTQQSDIGCCQIQYVNSRNERSISKRATDKSSIAGSEILKDVLEINHFPTSACGKIYSRKFLNQNNLSFRSGIVNEDTLFSIQCGCAARKISFVNAVLCNIREREGSISRSSFERLFKDMDLALTYAQEAIQDAQRWNPEIERIFRARYIRSTLYNLLQIAQRLNYADYKQNYDYCLKNTKFLEWRHYRAFLPAKHRLMSRIALSPKLLYATVRGLNKFHFRMH